MTKRAARYLRQSKTDAEGIDRQLERTAALITARRWTDAGAYVDNDVSASKNRGEGTAWARLLADADAGLLDVVVGVDLDRLVRSTRDLNTLIDRGLAVVTLDGEIDLSTADGEFRASMLASMARFEVRRKGERQTRANSQRAARGGVPKGVRLTGYTTDGELVPDEAATVRALFEGFAAGETLRGLARTYSMHPTSVRTALTNPRYAGRRIYKGEVVGRGDWAPVVPEALYDLVERRLADPARITNRTGSTSRKHLGTSLFECGECTDHPTVRTAGSGGRYWCKACGLVRTMEPVDEFVLAVLSARLSRPDARKAFESNADVEPLQDAVRAARARKGDLAGLVADGTLTRAEVKSAAADLDNKIAALDQQIAAIVAPGATTITDEEIAAGVTSLTLDRKRALIASTMSVRLRRAQRGSRKFDPKSVTIT